MGPIEYIFLATLLAASLVMFLVAMARLWKAERHQRRRTGLDVRGMGHTDEGFYYIKPVPLSLTERAKFLVARFRKMP